MINEGELYSRLWIQYGTLNQLMRETKEMLQAIYDNADKKTRDRWINPEDEE